MVNVLVVAIVVIVAVVTIIVEAIFTFSNQECGALGP